MTSIDIIMCPISVNIRLTHWQTANIDVNHHKYHWKVVKWPLTQRKSTILRIFNHCSCQTDVNVCAISINIQLTHYQTANIDRNHHKKHWKVVLWQFTQQKLMILRIFDHFRHWIDVNWRQYECHLNKYLSDTLTDYRNRYKPS